MNRFRSASYTLAFGLSLGLAAATARAEAPATQPADADADAAAAKPGYLGIAVDRSGAGFVDPGLGLPEGVGLHVRHVEAGSAAEAAGLRAGDVLHKLDDQVLVNAEQLVVLVRMHSPGEAVTLHVLRDGEAKRLEAQLGAAPDIPLPPDAPRPAIDLNPLMRDRAGAERDIEEAVEQAVRELNLRVQELDGGGARLRLVVPGDPDVRERVDDARARHRQLMLQLRAEAGLIPPGAAQGTATATMNDGEHKITVTAERHGGVVKRVVEVYDADGELLWEGRPTDDMSDLPADARKKVREMLSRMKLDPGDAEAPADADDGLRLD